jgi:hypothetical protein
LFSQETGDIKKSITHQLQPREPVMHLSGWKAPMQIQVYCHETKDHRFAYACLRQVHMESLGADEADGWMIWNQVINLHLSRA